MLPGWIYPFTTLLIGMQSFLTTNCESGVQNWWRQLVAVKQITLIFSCAEKSLSKENWYYISPAAVQNIICKKIIMLLLCCIGTYIQVKDLLFFCFFSHPNLPQSPYHISLVPFHSSTKSLASSVHSSTTYQTCRYGNVWNNVLLLLLIDDFYRPISNACWSSHGQIWRR